MQIIADSGSTKTAWRIVDDSGKVDQEVTVGLNPYYINRDKMLEVLQNSSMSAYHSHPVDIFFYGSGLASSQSANLLKEVLSKVLKKAQIHISDDLTAAARATCGHEPGIANILGTGSNSCYYDGQKIASNIPSSGFILGDEGSGSYMGKILIGDYIRGYMPSELANRLTKRFDLTRDKILENVYRQPQPNRFLAQFGKFIFQNLRHPYCTKLVLDGFDEFFEKYITQYRDYTNLPVHFTGSIAFYFSDLLRKTAKKYEVHVKNIIENPIAGLTLYHNKELKG